jgi:type VI protein secretion system component Hcp
MPQSDAFLELSDPGVWGETYDQQFGEQGRNLGAFEISKFDFGVSCSDDSDDSQGKAGSNAKPGAHGKPGGASKAGTPAAKIKEPTLQNFKISKYVDKGSPDLFLCCMKKTPIKWGILTVRESGEPDRKPYLILEFRNLRVMSFTWSLTPGDSGDDASQMETVEFDYETILIKYIRQEKEGVHRAMKAKGWNRKEHNDSVQELSKAIAVDTGGYETLQ